MKKRTSKASATTSLTEILADRGAQYGKFSTQAEISQCLQYIVNDALKRNPNVLKPDQREGLQIILHKISRIVNGNPHFEDSWRDIAGYATIVADRLQAEATNAK